LVKGFIITFIPKSSEPSVCVLEWSALSILKDAQTQANLFHLPQATGSKSEKVRKGKAIEIRGLASWKKNKIKEG
jgi:hypothetical protein